MRMDNATATIPCSTGEIILVCLIRIVCSTKCTPVDWGWGAGEGKQSACRPGNVGRLLVACPCRCGCRSGGVCGVGHCWLMLMTMMPSVSLLCLSLGFWSDGGRM